MSKQKIPEASITREQIVNFYNKRNLTFNDAHYIMQQFARSVLKVDWDPAKVHVGVVEKYGIMCLDALSRVYKVNLLLDEKKQLIKAF